jgi:hypothetical protein
MHYLCKTYDTIVDSMKKTSQRLQAIDPNMQELKGKEAEDYLKMQPEYAALLTSKGNLSRRVAKELEYWPIYALWLKHIPGMGPFLASNFILMYYYKHVPICKKCDADLDDDFKCTECGKGSSGGGLLKTRIVRRDFPNISKFHKFMGRHCDETGNMPKRQKGVKVDWSTKGRTLCYHWGELVNRQKAEHLYKEYMLKQKRKHAKKNSQREKEWTLGHIHNAGKHEMSRLFLSHFWHVARTIEGLSTSGPYIEIIGGHTGIIPPYYWDEVAFLAA